MKLKKINDFYLTDNNKFNKLPDVLKLDGKNYYKHMGFVYLPVRQDKLNKKQIIQIGNLRDKYFNSLIDRKFVEEVYLFVYNLFKNNEKKILDFGAGSGNFTEFLKGKNLLDSFEFNGIDINPKYKKNRLYSKYQIIKNRVKFLFLDNYFDIILALWVFHYNVPIGNLKEINRTLKDKGKFIFNLYKGNIKHKRYLLSNLKKAGFKYYKKILQSKILFNGTIHSPIEFYICYK